MYSQPIRQENSGSDSTAVINASTASNSTTVVDATPAQSSALSQPLTPQGDVKFLRSTLVEDMRKFYITNKSFFDKSQAELFGPSQSCPLDEVIRKLVLASVAYNDIYSSVLDEFRQRIYEVLPPIGKSSEDGAVVKSWKSLALQVLLTEMAGYFTLIGGSAARRQELFKERVAALSSLQGINHFAQAIITSLFTSALSQAGDRYSAATLLAFQTEINELAGCNTQGELERWLPLSAKQGRNTSHPYQEVKMEMAIAVYHAALGNQGLYDLRLRPLQRKHLLELARVVDAAPASGAADVAVTSPEAERVAAWKDALQRARIQEVHSLLGMEAQLLVSSGGSSALSAAKALSGRPLTLANMFSCTQQAERTLGARIKC